jgi:hypothetical protein
MAHFNLYGSRVVKEHDDTDWQVEKDMEKLERPVLI